MPGIVRKRKALEAEIYRDDGSYTKAAIAVGTGIPCQSEQEREQRLSQILQIRKESHAQHTLLEQQRLKICTDFKAFFGVAVPQRQIDAWCGFSSTTSKQCRSGPTLHERVNNGEKDPRGGRNKKITHNTTLQIDPCLQPLVQKDRPCESESKSRHIMPTKSDVQDKVQSGSSAT